MRSITAIMATYLNWHESGYAKYHVQNNPYDIESKSQY